MKILSKLSNACVRSDPLRIPLCNADRKIWVWKGPKLWKVPSRRWSNVSQADWDYASVYHYIIHITSALLGFAGHDAVFICSHGIPQTCIRGIYIRSVRGWSMAHVRVNVYFAGSTFGVFRSPLLTHFFRLCVSKTFLRLIPRTSSFWNHRKRAVQKDHVAWWGKSNDWQSCRSKNGCISSRVSGVHAK